MAVTVKAAIIGPTTNGTGTGRAEASATGAWERQQVVQQ